MSSPFPVACTVCGSTENLMRCSRCRIVIYCSKEHQKQDWKSHKVICKKIINNSKNIITSKSNETITTEGSSETEILNESAQVLSPSFEVNNTADKSVKSNSMLAPVVNDTMPTFSDDLLQKVIENPELSLPPYLRNQNSYQGDNYQLSVNLVEEMNKYGLCVLDNFLGREKGMTVLKEVLDMYNLGIFRDGQLVSSSIQSRNIRGDKITWLDGTEERCSNISQLIHKVDSIVMRANKMADNGKMGDYTINGRTKAMVACYPGSGTHYVKHVDNPNKDGRCITAIYYLNTDWDIATDGGLLRIFPEDYDEKVADIEPKFDRVLFFWSDRRNPHEVQPSHKTRFAITLWYFDAIERKEAMRRHREKGGNQQTQQKPPT